MINKQGLWFVTLFSLILVLSIYYVTMSDDTLSSILDNNQTTSEKSETVNVNVEESSILVALRVNDEEETLKDGSTREVMHFHPFIAPYKLAILPLVKKFHNEKATEIYKDLSKYFMCTYDESGNIGKRYRRADIIGTPFAITIDDETLNNKTVTIRERDTMEQTTLKIEEIKEFVEKRLTF